jgi:hypothetical protein
METPESWKSLDRERSSGRADQPSAGELADRITAAFTQANARGCARRLGEHFSA